MGYEHPVYNFCKIPSGRIRDLPESEQEPFVKRLYGQTCPWAPGIKEIEQDFFYICDYLEWKAGLPVMD